MSEKKTFVAFITNIVLAALKLFAAITTGSLALLSDAFNSVTDILSSFSAWYATRIAHKDADDDHPYGHQGAEPVAGLIIAIFIAVVGLEVIKDGLVNLFSSNQIAFSKLAFWIMLLTIVIKLVVWLYMRHGKGRKSLALKALTVDYRNDIVVTIIAIFGFVMGASISPIVDVLMALVVGVFILHSAYDIGKQNTMYLMGASPSKKVLNQIRGAAQSVEGVETTNDIRAHYMGSKIHAEVHINIKDSLNIVQGHRISKKVQRVVESLEDVKKAFIHVDPASNKR